MAPDDRARRIERSYLRFIGVGIQFALFLVLPTLLGIWIDGRLHASPVCTIVGFLLGFAAGTWNLLHANYGSDDGPGHTGSGDGPGSAGRPA